LQLVHVAFLSDQNVIHAGKDQAVMSQYLPHETDDFPDTSGEVIKGYGCYHPGTELPGPRLLLSQSDVLMNTDSYAFIASLFRLLARTNVASNEKPPVIKFVKDPLWR
jgi:hypothetical protein